MYNNFRAPCLRGDQKAAKEKRTSGTCQFLSSGFFGAVSEWHRWVFEEISFTALILKYAYWAFTLLAREHRSRTGNAKEVHDFFFLIIKFIGARLFF